MSDRSAPARAVRTARLANTVVFGIHAALLASWLPHIPSVKDKIGLNEGTLGLTLLGAPVGALVAIAVIGPALARWGSRRCMLVTMVGYAATGPALGLADSMPALFVALTVWGMFLGASDVAMNAQAVTIETHYARPIMSSFHAVWSACAGVGAALGTLALWADVSLAVQMLLLGGAMLTLTGPLLRALLGDDHRTPDLSTDDGTRGRRFSPKLVVIAGLMFAALLCEGAVGDWAPLYLRDVTHASEEVGGLGYTLFAFTMFMGRVFGDRWVARFGPDRVVGSLALAGAAGMGIGLLVADPLVALVAFAVYGLGIACIVPVCLSAAAAEARSTGGHVGPALALADGAGGIGILLGPPLIGGIAYATSLPVGMAVLPLLCVAVFAASRVLTTASSVRAD